jgi:hypothetical protein
MYSKPKIDIDWIMEHQEPDYDYPYAPIIPNRKEKSKATRKRRKHYKAIEQIRRFVIIEHFLEHAGHKIIATDTRYEDDVLMRDTINCDCGKTLELTKAMFDEENGKEYKL